MISCSGREEGDDKDWHGSWTALLFIGNRVRSTAGVDSTIPNLVIYRHGLYYDILPCSGHMAIVKCNNQQSTFNVS